MATVDKGTLMQLLHSAFKLPRDAQIRDIEAGLDTVAIEIESRGYEDFGASPLEINLADLVAKAV